MLMSLATEQMSVFKFQMHQENRASTFYLSIITYPKCLYRIWKPVFCLSVHH